MPFYEKTKIEPHQTKIKSTTPRQQKQKRNNNKKTETKKPKEGEK
jgi:hypothetical protein